MDYIDAIATRNRHLPRRRRWLPARIRRGLHRMLRRRTRCGTCGEPWPCPTYERARTRLEKLLREALRDDGATP